MRISKMSWGRVVAIGLMCALTSMGASMSMAGAVQVAGLGENAGQERTIGTDVLTIRLTQGNPDRDEAAPSGEIQGVSIHLKRLAGLHPTNPSHVRRVEETSLEDIRAWEKDLSLTKVTNSKGEVTFEGLADGFYLVSSSAPDDSYREINEFIVAVPFHTVSDNPNPVPGVIVAKTHNPGPTSTPTTTPPPPDTPPTSPSGGAITTSASTPPSTVVESAEPPMHSKESKTGNGSLAMTGVQVIGLLIAAAILIFTGVAMIAISRKKDTESEGR